MPDRPIATNWGAIPSEAVRKGVSRKGFGDENVILVMNEIEPEIEVAPHTHDEFDQIATIVEGHARYHVGGVAHEVGPGSLLFIPAGVEHYIEPTGGGRVLNMDVFAPARSDYSHLLEWMDEEVDPGK